MASNLASMCRNILSRRAHHLMKSSSRNEHSVTLKGRSRTDMLPVPEGPYEDYDKVRQQRNNVQWYSGLGLCTVVLIVIIKARLLWVTGSYPPPADFKKR